MPLDTPAFPGFEAPAFPSAFANSPFGANWENPVIVNIEQVVQLNSQPQNRIIEQVVQVNSVLKNEIKYQLFFDTDGLKLIDLYTKDTLFRDQGSFTDNLADLHIYYEYGTAGKLFDNICYVKMNRALFMHLGSVSSLRTPEYLADRILEHEHTLYGTSGTRVKMEKKRLLEAITYEIGANSLSLNILYLIPAKLLQIKAEEIRNMKPEAKRWDAESNNYAPFLNVTLGEAVVKEWVSLKAKLVGYKANLNEAAGWIRKYIPVIGFVAVAEALQKIALLLQNLVDAIDPIVSRIRAWVNIAKLVNAFICGAMTELLETIAGIVDVMALVLYLYEDKVQRDRLLNSIEKMVQELQENPWILIKSLEEAFEELKQRYDTDKNNKWQIAYNLGEDAVQVYLFVEGIVEAVKLIKNIPEMFAKLEDWSKKTLNKMQKQILENGEPASVAYVKRKRLIGRGIEMGEIIDGAGLKKVRRLLADLNVEFKIGPANGTYKIEGFFDTTGDVLELPASAAAAFVTDGTKMRMILRENATVYNLFHELMHFRHSKELGLKNYHALSKQGVPGSLIKERFVYDKMIQYRSYLTRDELVSANRYINKWYFKYHGNPKEVMTLPFDVNKIPVRRDKANLDRIFKLK